MRDIRDERRGEERPALGNFFAAASVYWMLPFTGGSDVPRLGYLVMLSRSPSELHNPPLPKRYGGGGHRERMEATSAEGIVRRRARFDGGRALRRWTLRSTL